MTTPSRTAPIFFYDGECGFCDATVRFLLSRTDPGTLHFSALQSPVARTAFASLGLGAPDLTSAYLLRDGRMFAQSDAILEALRLARGWSRPAGALQWIPRAARDAVYGMVARHRRQVRAGSSCRVLTTEERARFLS